MVRRVWRGEVTPLVVLDATTIREPENADEVLAYWLYYAEPDDVITLHSAWCRTQLHITEWCSCTPVTLKLGAKA